MRYIFQKERIRLLFTAFTALAVLLIGNGCATYSGKDIPVITLADLPPAPDDKTCLVISDKCTKDTCTDIDEIISIFEKSGYFLKAPEHCTPKDSYRSNKMIVTFDWTFRTGPYMVDLMNAFISGYTLTIIPMRMRDYYSMKVELKRNDRVVKQYMYSDHIERWLHLYFAFKRPNPDYSAREAVHDIYNRMIMNFLNDYANDVQKGDLFAEH